MPIRKYSNRQDCVKVRTYSTYTYVHTNQKNMRIEIFIGSNVVHSLGWAENDKIIMEERDNHLFIKKINPPLNNEGKYRPYKGYKLRKVPKSHSYSLNANCYMINELVDHKSKILKHKIAYVGNGNGKNDKALRIYFNGENRWEKGKIND